MSYVNEIINVNAFYFRGQGGRLKLFPRQIEFNNQNLTFQDGWQYLTRSGSHTAQLFDMFDGNQTYRLRFENNSWTLLGVR